jgi:hypothetical protein
MGFVSQERNSKIMKLVDSKKRRETSSKLNKSSFSRKDFFLYYKDQASSPW